MGKKVNAVLGLAVTTLLVIHIIYEIYAYLTFYYNPVLTKIIAYSILVTGVIHILISCYILFVSHDRGKGIRYPGLNIRTLLQRISACAIAVLLILHMNTFMLLTNTSKSSRVLFTAVLAIQILFYAFSLLHAGLSFVNALITLGLVSSEKIRKRTDTAVWIFCATLFAAASYIVVNTQIAMFINGGGAA